MGYQTQVVSTYSRTCRLISAIAELYIHVLLLVQITISFGSPSDSERLRDISLSIYQYLTLVTESVSQCHFRTLTQIVTFDT